MIETMKSLTRIAAVTVFALAIVAGIHFAGNKASSIVHGQQYSRCDSAAASPACQSAYTGNAAIAAAAQTVVVNDTSVTADNPIVVTYDQSLGTLLAVTCNTTAQQPYISARSPGASFTIKTASTFTTNPGCISWEISPQ
jgi:hypothetical protein